MKNIKTIISIILLFTFTSLSLFAPLSCSAFYGEVTAAQVVDNIFEWFMANIISMLVSVLKKAAVQMIVEMVDNMIAGNGMGEALYITNWQNFLVKETAENSAIMLNDLINTSLGGRSSGSTYLTDSGNAASGNYSTSLRSSAINVIFGNNPRSPVTEYIGDPKNMFNGGSMRAANAYYSNSKFGNLIKFKGIFNEDLKTQKTTATTKAIAYQGFKAAEKNGYVATPGSTIKDMKSDANDLGNKILASAKGVYEVITATVAKMLVGQVKKGIGNAQNNIQKDVSSTLGKFQREAANSINPSNTYKPSY